jgi:hypothetical protein
MNILFHICIFLIVLFLYVYIMNQFKKSEDLDIYEMDYSSNRNLQEICEIRQPVLFNFFAVDPNFFYDLSQQSIVKYGSYDVKIKDAHDYFNEDKNVDAVALSLTSTLNDPILFSLLAFLQSVCRVRLLHVDGCSVKMSRRITKKTNLCSIILICIHKRGTVHSIPCYQRYGTYYP